MLYLLDTNILSEIRKRKRANQGVVEFFVSTDPESVYLPVQVIGEIRSGIDGLRPRDPTQAAALETWLNLVLHEYSDRILLFDIECALVWGRLIAGQNQHPIDKQIAAIALVHDLVVVTNNTKDFMPCGVRTLNPFFITT
nr:type II toxin-antitoxin system VapC family toxin [uncultured Noviherbaspirillum sp.]